MSWAVYQSNRNLREAMTAAAQDDPHWQLNDIEAHRAKVPDAENSAMVIMAGNRLVDGSKKNAIKQQSWEEELDELFRYPNARASESQIAALPVIVIFPRMRVSRWNT